MGLGGLLRERADVLSGILNGIDTDVWNPQTDPHIAYRFGADDLTFRAANKAVLQQQFNLDSSDEAPLLGVISRLSWQKGLDLLLEAIRPSWATACSSHCSAAAIAISRIAIRPSPARTPGGSAS